MRAPCLRCGVVGLVHRHHPLGKAGGVYLSDFTVTLCLACHESADRVRRLACSERVDVATPVVILARLCGFFGWWCLGGAAMPASVVVDVATILEQTVRDLRVRKVAA